MTGTKTTKLRHQRSYEGGPGFGREDELQEVICAMKQQVAATPQRPQFAVVRSSSDRRPSVHTEPWSKVTMMMEDHHVTYLDLVSMFMRVRHHRTVARAEIVRAFVEFMERSEIDFTQFATIEDMTAYLTEYFRQIPNRGRLPLHESGLFHRRHFEHEHGGHAIDVSQGT